MFRVGRVSDAALAVIARESEGAAVTYAEVGATLAGQMPDGFRHDRHEIRLPTADDAFDRAAAGIRGWAPHLGAGLRVAPRRPPEVGATVAVAAPVGPISAIAICRIVAVVDEPDRFGFAYGTLPGHPECGEEAFVVERTNRGAVFTITVFWKPAELLARVGGPITRRVQKSATKGYLEALASFVADQPNRGGVR